MTNSLLSPLPLWIAGKAQTSQETFANLNPYTQDKLCDVAIANAGHVEEAVTKAAEAQQEWADRPAKDRARVLRRAAEILRSRNDELARLETLDTGRPLRETKAVDVISAADCLEYFASLIEVQSTRMIALADGTFAYTLQKPLGICAGIGAWNYPLQVATWKAAPALAAGNAFILKPSEFTPTTSFHLGGILQEAGLPDGLFSVLQGQGAVGAALVQHPRIRKVSLTGSVPTGIRVYEASARFLKKVSLELGGKSPFIIFADADLDDAVHAAMLANFYSQGAICSNGTRVFVQSTVKAEFERRLVAATRELRMGDPLDPETQIGPLVHADHKKKVWQYIEQGRAEGARELTAAARDTGNFVSPTIFTDCRDDMTIVKEEIFGPVMAILSYQDEDEVVTRANATEFGLAGGVFTSDVRRAHRVAQRLEAGICWINNYNITPVEIPFGGAKMSGIGSENGHEAMKEYTRVQTIYCEGSGEPIRF